MNPYLLIGAGFSRNWGGWLANEAFEYLLGDRSVMLSPPLRDLLWTTQPKGGFEVALDELHRIVERDSSKMYLLAALESAVARMFSDMNSHYTHFEFVGGESMFDRRPVQSFLCRFKAIFTLNQDLLLERHYLANKENNLDLESWKRWQIPGMQLEPPLAHEGPIYPSATGTWQPSGNHTLGPEQPVFKLHGSSNWRTTDAKHMLILGGGKKGEIARHPVLNWYFDEFSSRLHEPEARLMIIGYSFRDPHVNEVLQSAIANGLKIFIIDANGSDVARLVNPTARSGEIYKKISLEEDIQTALIGASRRLLREIFGGDGIERAKVMRFFEA